MSTATRVAWLIGVLGSGLWPGATAQCQQLGVVVVGTTRPALGGVIGPSLGVMVSRRDRVVGTVGLGSREAGLIGRGEVGWQILLDPARQKGVSPFAGAGIAVERDTAWRELVMVEVGVAVHPGRGPGWVLSVGVGGGLRLMVSHHWRVGPPRRDS